MDSVLVNLFSWPFVIGLVAGFLIDRAYRYALAVLAGRGDRWSAITIDGRWLAGVIAFGVAGWSIYQTQANANEAQRITNEATAFAQRTQDCQAALISAIIGSRRITADNDRLSIGERELLADQQRVQTEWLGRLLNPPPEVADLDINDPVRKRYNIDITRGFLARSEEIRQRIDVIADEQRTTDKHRPPLPDPNCGE